MSSDFNFLEDESLTDNCTDISAKNIISWLEQVAKNSPENLNKMLSFIRFYNVNFKEIGSESDLGAFLELFDVLLESPESDLGAQIFVANFILTIGEKNEPQSKKITN